MMKWIAIKGANSVPRGVPLWVDYWGQVEFLPANTSEDELRKWLLQCGHYMLADVPSPAEKTNCHIEARHAAEMSRKLEDIRDRLRDGDADGNKRLQSVIRYLEAAIAELDEFMVKDDKE